MGTCRNWHRLGSEFLFRCLFFDDPTNIRALCAILDKYSSLGWWTKRIHVARSHRGSGGTTVDDIENALVSVIRHCPNLEIFVFDWPMGNAFGPVADALATYSKSIRTVHWNAPAEALPKVIWALASLPLIVSAHIEFGPPDSETVLLGAASDLRLTLRNLQQLSLSGYFQDFLEQASGWHIPSIKSVALDCGTTQMDQPDVVEFLTHHGASLIFLDLFCISPLDLPKILDLCPLLTTFTFNADWRLPIPDEDRFESVAAIVNRPHERITHIGCHGLLYAFGVGYAASYATIEPLRSHMIKRTNDRNFGALTKSNFPALKCIRALSRTVLRDLNAANGPEYSCYERWERWWNQCTSQGIRLEDCTGNELGFLPDESEGEDEGEEEEDEDGDGDDTFEIEEDADGMGFKFVIPPRPEDDPVNELKQLLEECRKMSAERDDDLIIPPPDWQ
jgi:hypothetical protein